MASPTQFRHYLIAQDAEGNNIEIVRAPEQVCVLAFDSQRLAFVHCHVLLETLKNRRQFDDHGHKLSDVGHPLLARVLEFGEDEGSAYYITENVDGELLSAYFDQHDELPVWLAMQITGLTLQAVRALVSIGDFLPSDPINSLRLVQTGANSLQVKLSDFRMVEESGSRSAKARIAKDAFSKQSHFLESYLAERLQSTSGMDAPKLTTSDFREIIQSVLGACAPGMEEQIDTFIGRLITILPPLPSGELAATYKPKPLLAPLLASFQEIARSVVQNVRIQSQKLDAGHPYSMRGLHLKTGQHVLVEQVVPRRMAGSTPHEVLQHVKNLPKTGKFPNLVPVVLADKTEEIECMAETAVEGVPLNAVLESRQTLDVQEAYLVLAGVDAALSQLERANLTTPRLRLEDIFLFTGFSKQSPQDSTLLSQKLNEWPGFSIVVRPHPCLHAMTGRGTDPAMLLPLHMKTKGDAESLWNGAWMAALGCFLAGMPSGVAAKHQTGVPETDTVYRLLDDEISKARKGNPSSRASFLARFARVMQQFDLAQFTRSGGFWTELSGSATAQGHAAEVSRAATATPLPSSDSKKAPRIPLPTAKAAAAAAAGVHQHDEPDDDEPGIGFAEALISQQRSEKSRPPTRQEMEESSWMTLHEKRPFWVSFAMLFFGSLLAGMALAHLSGRAFWQEGLVLPPPRVVPVAPKPPEITLPDPKPVTPKPEATKVKAPASAASPTPPKAIPIPEPGPDGTLDTLSSRLQAVRKSGEKLTPSLRMEAEMAAKSGNTEAMIAMGRALLRGDNTAVDEPAAFSWFSKAAAAGAPAAAMPLAECYIQGWGTEQDYPRAITILTKASTAGDAAAKDLLGVCYARGLGVVRDDAKAFSLCEEAYQGGVVSACGSLGSMYLRGQGVPADAAKAVQLYAEGASRGHADSMWSYAQCLENGTGTTASRVEAMQWYQQAARLGNAEAISWCRQKNVAY